MKRYRFVSLGDDHLLGPANQKQKQSDARDDEHQEAPNQESEAGTSKPNDTRLCLLSIVCDQRLSDKQIDNKSQAQTNRQTANESSATEIARRSVRSDQEERKEALIGILKSAEQVLGIVTPAVISPNEDENTGDLPDDSSQADKAHCPTNKKAQTSGDTSNSQPTPALISKEASLEQDENETETPSIWKEVCRPVPLPPRLPMVPAGFVFPLFKSPNMM